MFNLSNRSNVYAHYHSHRPFWHLYMSNKVPHSLVQQPAQKHRARDISRWFWVLIKHPLHEPARLARVCLTTSARWCLARLREAILASVTNSFPFSLCNFNLHCSVSCPTNNSSSMNFKTSIIYTLNIKRIQFMNSLTLFNLNTNSLSIFE